MNIAFKDDVSFCDGVKPEERPKGRDERDPDPNHYHQELGGLHTH